MVPTISQAAQDKLLQYPWPGNVRELDNVIQRALILCENNQIQQQDILLEHFDWLDTESPEVVTTSEPSVIAVRPKVPITGEGLGSELREQEFSIILETLVACDGSRKDVAEQLGISPRTLRYKLAKMRDAGIEIPA